MQSLLLALPSSSPQTGKAAPVVWGTSGWEGMKEISGEVNNFPKSDRSLSMCKVPNMEHPSPQSGDIILSFPTGILTSSQSTAKDSRTHRSNFARIGFFFKLFLLASRKA